MTAMNIEREFKSKVCAEVTMKPEGVDRWRIFTPFCFDDGDHLAIVLKKEHERWLLSDEGHTLMHLTYSIDERDLLKGTRNKIISNTLEMFRIKEREGELLLPVDNNQYGDSLFAFTQALIKLSDVSYLTRERVKSTFIEDFRSFLREAVPEGRRKFDWVDKQHDPEGMYPVDCKINGKGIPLFIYALNNDDRVRDAMISILTFETWGLNFNSIGIFENQEEIGRKVLARFSDVCEKQFSSLGSNKDRINKFISDHLAQYS